MKNTRMVKLIGVAVAILLYIQVTATAAPPRGNTVTVVPTTSGPWLCGPAIVIQNMGGPTWPASPARMGSVVLPPSPRSRPMGSARLSPFMAPFMGPAVHVPPSQPGPNDRLCRPLYAPRQAWPVRPSGVYGGQLAR